MARRDPFGDDDSAFDLPEQSEAPFTLMEAELGVPTAWLSRVFGHSERSVKNRLIGIVPKGYTKRGAPLYVIAEAAPHLVEAKFDVEAVIKKMRPQDMPPMLQAVFWDGQNKKLTWAEKAGHLWHTDDVLSVLTEMFKTMRSTMQLWVETVEKAEQLKPAQVVFLRAQVDALQDELYQQMLDAQKNEATGPVSDRPLDKIGKTPSDELLKSGTNDRSDSGIHTASRTSVGRRRVREI